jgi:hypothetical protein
VTHSIERREVEFLDDASTSSMQKFNMCHDVAWNLDEDDL